ncbi:hypothetical protein RUND412_005312 [Rhizina undulata]
MGTTTTSTGFSLRLPSPPGPPPFTEVQIPPAPPITSPPTAAPRHPSSTRRIRPGTKNSQIAMGPPLIPLSELDSAFQLQEHLAALLSSITSPTISETTTALTRDACETLSMPPDGVEESLWRYELTRRLTRDLNVLVVALLNDNCTAASCPEMRAGEWQYLCAVHDPPQSCCAIDYSTHTLDHAATMLCSTRYFPSRLSLQSGSIKHLGSIFRRLYRIFAHAWFQHRNVFWEVEVEYGLYLFFKTVSDHYDLIPSDNLTIPPEAEGLKSPDPEFMLDDDDDEEIDEFDRGLRGHGALTDFLDDHDEDDDYPSDEDSGSEPENDGDRDEDFEDEFEGSDDDLREDIEEEKAGEVNAEGREDEEKQMEEEDAADREKRGERETSLSPESEANEVESPPSSPPEIDEHEVKDTAAPKDEERDKGKEQEAAGPAEVVTSEPNIVAS